MFTVLFYRIEVSTGSISQNVVCKLCFSPVHISVRSWFHTVFIQTHVACGCLLAWVLLRTLLHCFFFFSCDVLNTLTLTVFSEELLKFCTNEWRKVGSCWDAALHSLLWRCFPHKCMYSTAWSPALWGCLKLALLEPGQSSGVCSMLYNGAGRCNLVFHTWAKPFSSGWCFFLCCTFVFSLCLLIFLTSWSFLTHFLYAHSVMYVSASVHYLQ